MLPAAPWIIMLEVAIGALIIPGGLASIDCHVKRHKGEAAQGRGGV